MTDAFGAVELVENALAKQKFDKEQTIVIVQIFSGVKAHLEKEKEEAAIKKAEEEAKKKEEEEAKNLEGTSQDPIVEVKE